MAQPHRFTCALCHEDCTSAWTDDQAEAEFEAKFPGEDAEDTAVVCDACYRRVGMGVN